jgi:hypothetical protein
LNNSKKRLFLRIRNEITVNSLINHHLHKPLLAWFLFGNMQLNNMVPMKTMFLLLVLSFCSVSLLAQSDIPSFKKESDQKNRYELNPDKRSKTDNPFLAYKPPAVTEKYIQPGNRPGKETPSFPMPVITGKKFPSNMPIMIPDSSIHYYLKIKKIEGNFLRVKE